MRNLYLWENQYQDGRIIKMDFKQIVFHNVIYLNFRLGSNSGLLGWLHMDYLVSTPSVDVFKQTIVLNENIHLRH